MLTEKKKKKKKNFADHPTRTQSETAIKPIYNFTHTLLGVSHPVAPRVTNNLKGPSPHPLPAITYARCGSTLLKRYLRLPTLVGGSTVQVQSD